MKIELEDMHLVFNIRCASCDQEIPVYAMNEGGRLIGLDKDQDKHNPSCKEHRR